ncbi:MAG: glycosyltransferase, partial [Thiohalobacterales bacterium]|nr:glycosyltransferase [Thiohalobacterales bacterium]
MTTVVELGHSSTWQDSGSALPEWLDRDWIGANDAFLLCRLDDPDHLYAIRDLVPCPDRLVAIPHYPLQNALLEPAERDQLDALLLDAMRAEDYVTITPSGPQRDTHTAGARFPVARVTRDRPLLALVSPMPPTPTGIASYCCEILPSLAKLYDVTLVVADPAGLREDLATDFSAISHQQFISSGQSFDRVMYHFGNSHFHYDYFTMLKIHPGTVVLHDIYLGDCIFSNHATMGDTELRQAVYASHGWSAMQDCEASPRQTIGVYPACGQVFADAYGVIVHNHFAAETLSLFFDQDVLARLSTTVHAREVRAFPTRGDARAALGLDDSATLIGSFGHINRNKCYTELMQAWTLSGLDQDPNNRLLLLGGCGDRIFESQIHDWINGLRYPGQVLYTGYLDTDTYDLYLPAIDVAVQLRRNSRGESSGALFDCMGAGLPTIVNAHGSMAEVPD